MGFADAARAERLLVDDLGGTAAGLKTDVVVTATAAAADPDLALTGLARLFDAADRPDALRAALRGEQDFRERLTAVLGVSAGLADHLARHPEDSEVLRGTLSLVDPAELREEMLRAVGADPESFGGLADPMASGDRAASGQQPVTALAAAYRRRLLQLAARDLTGVATVDVVGEELADIAAAVLEAALAVARAELPPSAAPCRLAVVAMGKCGGRELNYASDVDVVFVAEPVKDEDETAALATAGRLAAGLIGVCARSTPEGSIFPVDPNLRPEGRAGPLVRTLASHLAYYERWAGGGRHGARPGVRRHPRPAGLAGGPPRAFRRGRAGHAPPGGAVAAAQAGRARAQARPRRAAGHRVRRPAAAARARPHRRNAPRAGHAAGARGPGRRRVRRPRRRGRAGRRLPVLAPHRAPAATEPAEPHAHLAGGSRRTSQARPGDAI